MLGVVLDTHALVWLLANSPRLSENAAGAIETATTAGKAVVVASISIVEIIYLVEKGRLPPDAYERLGEALRDASSPLVVAALDSGVANAITRIPRDLVPDMPDRVIAATALHLGLSLITRDGKIRAAEVPGLTTVW
jgi:PIN domain nuclease of toxin-antitoxin system